MACRRLDQVDAMRPIKQAGVISTHSVLYFAPAAASVGSGAALLLLHVSREGFFFISACMLTYAYAELGVGGLRRYYGRRCLSVVIPYLCWTVIYFLYLLGADPDRDRRSRLHGASGAGRLAHHRADVVASLIDTELLVGGQPGGAKCAHRHGGRVTADVRHP